MCSMKKMYLSKCAAAVALLFAVNMNADAQFGKLKNLAKKVVKETVEETVSGTSSSSSSSTSVTDVKNVVASAAAPGELPWPMSREGQSNIMQYIEKMETASTEEVAKLRDDMIKRYLYNETAKPSEGYNENMRFSSFLQNIFNQMGLVNSHKVKIIDGRFDIDVPNGKIEMFVPNAFVYIKVTEQGKAYFISTSNHMGVYLEGDRLEGAKNSLKRVENYRTFFAVAGKGLSKDLEEEFEANYNKATMYITFLQDAINGNSPANIERRAMPKTGSLNGSLNAAALKISKQQDSKTVSVVITRDAWDVKKNALGQPICRVAYGYRILQTSQGKKAVSCSWAQDYQGGGKYGSLRHYGVGTESFYVK